MGSTVLGSQLQAEVAHHCDEIRALFAVPCRVTVVVRHPTLQDGGLIVTDDSFEKVIDEIRRLDTPRAAVVEMVPVHSSNVEAVGWYAKPPISAGVLRVAFKGGTVYDYDNVSRAWFDAFLQAPSKGKELQVIKADPAAYPARKVQ